MDVIDTTLRVGSREKLHPKHGYDEEVGTQLAVDVKLHSEKLVVELMCNTFCEHNPPTNTGKAADFANQFSLHCSAGVCRWIMPSKNVTHHLHRGDYTVNNQP